VLEKGVNFFVVVIRVVVKEHEFFHAGLECERHGIVHTAMAPASVLFIFTAIVLGIEDKHVGVADEFDHVAVVAALARFGIWKKTDQAVGREQPVTNGHAGVIGAMRAHKDFADGKIEIAQFLDLDVAGQLGKGDGKVGAFHLAGERGDEAAARAFAAEHAEAAARIINGRKKWQALDVVPMRVRNKQGEIERFAFEFRCEGQAEFAQARAAIQDDDVIAVADFDASGVAAITDGGRPGRGNGAANTPEFDVRAVLNGMNLTQPMEK